MGELKPLVEPVVKTDIVLYEGVTTLAGNVGGTTLIDAALIGSNDFLTDVTMYITSGAASLETRDITGFNPANGTITVGTAFSAQIAAGVTFKVLAFKPATAEVAELLALIQSTAVENESVWVATAPAPITANAEYPILEVLVSGGVIYVYRYNFASGAVPAVPTETLGRTEITHFDGDVFELSKLFVNINKVTTGLFPKMGATDKAYIYAKYYDTTASAFVLVPDIVIRNKAVDTLITAPPIQTDLGEAIVFDGAKLQLASRFIIYFYNDANIASEVRIPFTFGVRRAR